MEIGSFNERFLWAASQMKIHEGFQSIIVTLN